jgi:NADPH-dependent 2,4-dienoyl-CoA reductase/sulfur reductase-like enzyme
MRSIVIVGASLAGLRSAEALRKRGYDGRLWLVGEEPDAPYDRPPLSKQVLTGEWAPERAFFRQKEGYDGLALELRFGQRASALDPHTRELRLESGERLPYDGLVIATGAAAWKPAIPGHDLPGVHVLRTLQDAIAIRAALAAKPRVIVIGAGFIGLEVAASCRRMGAAVTVIEAEALPLSRVLGPPIGRAVLQMHTQHGAELRMASLVSAIEGDGRVERVRLSDGASLPADLVVVGVGVKPQTEWLASSGIALGNGVLCDARCATSLPDVVAAGDVAHWPNALYGESMRVEHWSNAVEQAQIAAARLLGAESAPSPLSLVPYFWSDQYDVKLQFAGRARPDDELVLVDGQLGDRAYVALFGREGLLRGVLASNRPAQFIRLRKLLAEPTPFARALAAFDRA